MKILAKKIEVISYFVVDGGLKPIRFRIVYDDGREVVVGVNRIFHTEERKLGGIRSIVYRCQSLIGAEERVYELKYDVEALQWYLYKF